MLIQKQGAEEHIATTKEVRSVLVAEWYYESPTNRRSLRQFQLRRELDRIIRIIKGTKK